MNGNFEVGLQDVPATGIEANTIIGLGILLMVLFAHRQLHWVAICGRFDSFCAFSNYPPQILNVCLEDGDFCSDSALPSACDRMC